VQPYNALLTLSHLQDASDGVLLLQNEVLHGTCTKLLGQQRPGFMVRSHGAWVGVLLAWVGLGACAGGAVSRE